MNYIPKIPQNINGQEVFVDPFSIDFVNRVISINCEINNDVASVFNASIRNLALKSDEDITIYINSPGGSVSDGFSMFDTINAVKKRGIDVVTCATGMAASMAAFLLTCAGTKGKRYCEPNAKTMIHQPLGSIQGQETDIRNAAKHMEETRKKLNKMLSEATGQPIEIINADTERDNYMTAEQAKEYGLADKIGCPFEEI